MQIDPRWSTELYIKAALILLAVALFAAITFFWATSFLVCGSCWCILAGAMHLWLCIMLDIELSCLSVLPVECASNKLSSQLQVALPCAAILGIAMAEVGVSIQHDANHGAFSKCAVM